MEDVPEPSPAEGEVLVKLKCCGVCGTDLEKVQGVGITTKILGHEAVGEVEEVGKKGLRSFKNLNELWTIVNGRSKKSGVGRKEEMPGEHPPGGRQKRGHET